MGLLFCLSRGGQTWERRQRWVVESADEEDLRESTQLLAACPAALHQQSNHEEVHGIGYGLAVGPES